MSASVYNKIRPIRTTYKDIEYRSKLEAQWAYYLSIIGVPYEYEFKTFKLVGRKYTPDFMINRRLYLEVKPEIFTLDTVEKIHTLALMHNVNMFLCAGDFYNGLEMMKVDTNGIITFDHEFVKCIRCGTLTIANTTVCPVCNHTVITFEDKWKNVREKFKAK